MGSVLLTLLTETPPPRPLAAELAESVELKTSSMAMRPVAAGAALYKVWGKGVGGRVGDKELVSLPVL